jgi:outer membrane protein TolC
VITFSHAKIGILFVIFLVVAACAVGPDFKAPKAPATKAYTEGALPAETEATTGICGAAQRSVSGKDIPRDWWTLFQSEESDYVIRIALADGPGIAAAKARLRQADENRRAQYGSLFPAVDANVSASRQQISGAGFGQPDATVSAFNL